LRGAAVSEFERSPAGPTRSEDSEICIRSRSANRDARLPEALPLEGPVLAFGLGVGKASALEAQGRNDVVAGVQLVLPAKSGRLDPEKFLACRLGNWPHALSLVDQLPR
jgi:hypothetical protein